MRLASVLLALGASPAQETSPPPTVLVELHGPLDTSAQALLARAVRSVKGVPDAMLVVALDTPGGDIEIMGDMGRLLDGAGKAGGGTVTTVAWIERGQSGGAFSAGAFVALSCDRIYMERGSSIGAARPIAVPFLGVPEEQKSGKLVSAIAARFRSVASEHNRDPRIAAAFVDSDAGLYKVHLADGTTGLRAASELEDLDRNGQRYEIVKSIQTPGGDRPLSLSASEAFDLDFIEGVAADRDELYRTLGREAPAVKAVELSPGASFLRLLLDATPILLVAGLIFGFIEAKIPGFGIFGVLSALCFGLVFFGRYLLGVADILEILLFFLGIGLIGVELFVAPGSAVFGILGGICMVLGLALSFQTFLLPKDALDVRRLGENVGEFVGLLLLATIGMLILSRFLPKTPLLRRSVLSPPVGVEGSAAGAIAEASSSRRATCARRASSRPKASASTR